MNVGARPRSMWPVPILVPFTLLLSIEQRMTRFPFPLKPKTRYDLVLHLATESGSKILSINYPLRTTEGSSSDRNFNHGTPKNQTNIFCRAVPRNDYIK